MTDELDRLKTALAKTPPPAPGEGAEARALAIAMAAYDAEFSHPAQGSAAQERLTPDRAHWLGDIRERIETMIGTLTSRPALSGAAGLTAVALVAVAVLQPAPWPGSGGDYAADVAGQGTAAPELAELAEAPAREDGFVGRSAADARMAANAPAAERRVAAEPTPRPAPAASAPGREPAPSARTADTASMVDALSLDGAAEGRVGVLPMPPGDMAPPAPAARQQGRDRFAEVDANPVRVTADHPVSTFSVDVDTASYAFARRMLMEGLLPPEDAVRPEEFINYFAYDYPMPQSRETPFALDLALIETPWNAETQLLRIGLQGFALAPEETPPANLVFLIDTSGSMQAADKLPLLLSSFRLLLDRLGPKDTVSIVTYAGSAGTVLEPTPVSDRRKILGALERLTAGGSTAGGEGIRQAYRLAEESFDAQAINRVILATDGDFNVGITDRAQLQDFVERKRAEGIFLSVLGFGRGNLNDELMQALAQNGNGQAAYIDTLAEARKVLVEEASSTLFPIARDVKVQVEFNPATVAEYRLIGYETRALAREDFDNDAVDAAEIGAGHRVTALYEITPVGSPARRVDDLRYAPADAAQPDVGLAGELAFVKLRHKPMDSDESALITRAATPALADETTGTRLRETRFAAAAAGFAELLRGSPYLGDWGAAEAIGLAQSAKGPDPFGYRAEMITLLRLAESASALEPQRR